VVEEEGRLMFIHIPDRREILECLAAEELEWMEDALRPGVAQEPPTVREASADCRFWAARRTER
jgi:hypothetical protein